MKKFWMKKYREIPRKSGFERPFNAFQVLSWILFCFNLLIYYFIIIPVFPFDSQVFIFFFLIIETWYLVGLRFSIFSLLLFHCIFWIQSHQHWPNRLDCLSGKKLFNKKVKFGNKKFIRELFKIQFRICNRIKTILHGM